MNNIIILLIKNLSIKTGGAASAFELARTLQLLGYNPHIFVPEFDLFYFANKYKYLKIRGSFINNVHYAPGFFLNMFFANKLNELLGNLFWHLLKGIFTLSKTDIKRVLEIVFHLAHSHNVDHFNFLLKNAKIIIQAAGLKGKELRFLRENCQATIVLNHAGSPETFENFWITRQHLSGIYNQSLSLYVNFCLCYDKILFQTEEHAIECAKKHPKLRESVMIILPTCDEIEVLKAKESTSPYYKDKFIIVNIGTIIPRKAPHRSIEAFATIASDYPQTELHFVGGYAGFKKYRLQLKRQIKELALENRIFFHGYRKDYLRFMAHANILLQSSEAEGVSRALREAMFLKLPIVSFSISGTRDVLENNKEAFLAPEKNSKELGRMIGVLLKDNNLLNKIRNAAYEKYLIKHSNLIYTTKVKTEFQKLLNNPAAKRVS